MEGASREDGRGLGGSREGSEETGDGARGLGRRKERGSREDWGGGRRVGARRIGGGGGREPGRK